MKDTVSLLYLNRKGRGTWLAQCVEHVTPDLEVVSSSPILGLEVTLKSLGRWLRCWVSAFGSGHDPSVLGLSPTSGFLLLGKPGSPSPASPAYIPSLTLSLSNK